MRKSRAVNAATILSLLVCFALVPGLGRSETTWASLSKQMIDQCTKFKQSVKDMAFTMELSVPSSEGPITSKSAVYQKGERFRAEISMEGMEEAGIPAEMASMKTIVIGDDKTAWVINPMMGKSKIPPDEAGKYRGQWQCGDYVPSDAAIIGSEKIAGRDCWVLDVKDKDADFAKLWIDQKNFNLMKAEGNAGEGETNVTLFSDYRKVMGEFEFPFKTELYSGKDLITTVTMKTIEINKGLADDLFDADKIKVEGPNVQDMMKKLKEKVKEVEDE